VLTKLEKMDEAANYLMLLSDGDKRLTETCGLTPTDALNLMQPLHAQMDELTAKGKFLITDKELSICEANCHCGLYSDLARNKQLKNDLFKKAEAFPRKKLIACANKTKEWICHDQLLQKLKSELNNFTTNAL
jgi:hypothetical protein